MGCHALLQRIFLINPPGIELVTPVAPALQADSLLLGHCRENLVPGKLKKENGVDRHESQICAIGFDSFLLGRD